MNVAKTSFITGVALIIAFSSRAQQTLQPSIKQELQTYLHAIHLKKGFSGEVLIAKGDSILFQEAVGLASLEQQVKLKPGATYRIASLTKTFTASLIAIAQEEGKLEYSDKASLYCKGLADTFGEITIHQLLTHTSGLPHNEAIPDYWLVKSKLQFNNEQLLKEINQLDLLFPPGTQMKYSSPGYSLLALVLEAVYKKEYKHLLEEKILSKLQLIKSGSPATLEIIPGLAAGYHFLSDDSLVVAPYRNYSLLKGAGDMVSTTTDLLKWSNSFLSNTFLSDQTRALIFTPAALPAEADGKSYGYGWFIAPEKAGKYFHGGGTWGYSSYIAFFPEDSVSLIMLSNVSSLPMESVAGELEKIFRGRPFSMPVVAEEEEQEAVTPAMYSGRYVSASGMELHIGKKGAGLFARLSGNPAFEIYPKGNHQFFGKKIEVLLSFTLTDGTVSGLKAERMGQEFYFKKD